MHGTSPAQGPPQKATGSTPHVTSVSITSLPTSLPTSRQQPPPPPRRRQQRGRSAVALGLVIVLLLLLLTGRLDPLLAAGIDRVTGAASSVTATAQDRMQKVAAWYPYGVSKGEREGSAPTAGSGAGSGAGAGAGATVRRRGPAGIAPKEPSGPSAPSPAVEADGTPERSSRWQWPNFSSAPRKVPPKMEPMGSCPQRNGAEVTIPVVAKAGPKGSGTAVVTWWDLGHPDRHSYQIGAVQVSRPYPPDITWTQVEVPQECGQMTVTIRGLIPGAMYQFYLESLTVSPLNGTRRSLMRGRTDIVETP